jgi:hypothetical protein
MFDRDFEWSELTRFVTYPGHQATLGMVSGRRRLQAAVGVVTGQRDVFSMRGGLSMAYPGTTSSLRQYSWRRIVWQVPAWVGMPRPGGVRKARGWTSFLPARSASAGTARQ